MCFHISVEVGRVGFQQVIFIQINKVTFIRAEPDLVGSAYVELEEYIRQFTGTERHVQLFSRSTGRNVFPYNVHTSHLSVLLPHLDLIEIRLHGRIVDHDVQAFAGRGQREFGQCTAHGEHQHEQDCEELFHCVYPFRYFRASEALMSA